MSDLLLHYERVGASGSKRLALVVHGAFGSGQNFRSFTRKLAERCPQYAFILVDLRAHGDSGSGAAPHTLGAAAADLERLAQLLSVTPPQNGSPPGGQVEVVIGHSLGGKVALELARRGQWPVREVWALDSNPGAQDPSSARQIRQVVTAVQQVSLPIESRAALVTALLAAGLSNGLAQWMTTNLRRSAEGYRWAFDLAAVQALLSDYFVQDLWPYLEAAEGEPALHLVVAERSDRWSDAMRERTSVLTGRGSVRIHFLPDSGHWVHVDNPMGLLQMLEQELNRA